MIGDKDVALKYFEENKVDPSAFEFVHTTQVIEMAEHPTKAFS
jgi:fatty acid/phospholipid biosynthesis enzyme